MSGTFWLFTLLKQSQDRKERREYRGFETEVGGRLAGTMKGILPMYSCCLRALAKQATSTSRQHVAAAAGGGEGQTTTTAAMLESATRSTTPRHRHLHSSRAASIPQASTSAAPSSATATGFPVHAATLSSSKTASNSEQSNTMYYQPSVEQVTSHLNTLLEGLHPPLSPELAMRMVTHKGSSSSNLSSSQHNTKLSLIGAFPASIERFH